ncbi:predicted protein [Nematostella vectensis]|uniref:Protein NDRG3 n=1 Tax=Nematostella vectensis TaxID=45351 RepID=A7S803_NEMVE|nr:predicted protein [Nematostella vectensis]|eukprot:XP_001632227.1 predicted protein [Nematostella vectensis]
MQGTEGKPAIVTFHDIGQNHTSAFLGFFNFVDVQPLLEHFCIYHIDAPGQENCEKQLPETFVYPTMEELADFVVHEVVKQLSISRFIGLGVGAGANVLCRYGLMYPDFVDALVLVNLSVGKSGWIEWGYQKVCVRQLHNKGLTTFVEDYLLWHHFGEKTKEENLDLSSAYKDSLRSLLNPHNLALFINSYITRTNIDIVRPVEGGPNPRSLKCPTLLVTGTFSPHGDDVVESNSRLDPKISEYMKVSDCGGMPLEEQPAKVAQALILFLQGNGYVQRLRACSTRGLSSTASSSQTSSQSLSSGSPARSSQSLSTDSPAKTNLGPVAC